MKNILLGLCLLIPLASFADNSGFANMTLPEIYERGYMLEATVDRDAGIRFRAGRTTQSVGGCIIHLYNLAASDSILKKTRVIALNKIRDPSRGSISGVLSSTGDKSVAGLVYESRSKSPSEVTLEELTSKCANQLVFTVVENDQLVEL